MLLNCKDPGCVLQDRHKARLALCLPLLQQSNKSCSCASSLSLGSLPACRQPEIISLELEEPIPGSWQAPDALDCHPVLQTSRSPCRAKQQKVVPVLLGGQPRLSAKF